MTGGRQRDWCRAWELRCGRILHTMREAVRKRLLKPQTNRTGPHTRPAPDPRITPARRAPPPKPVFSSASAIHTSWKHRTPVGHSHHLLQYMPAGSTKPRRPFTSAFVIHASRQRRALAVHRLSAFLHFPAQAPNTDATAAPLRTKTGIRSSGEAASTSVPPE